MARTITWLHISDLHARIRDDWDSHQITEALTRDLKLMQKGHGFRPDLIFFTGDVAFGMTNTEKMSDQYEKAGIFLNEVRRAFSPEISLRNLYLVPGNHDVDRSEITPDQTDWLRNPNRTLAEILSAMRDSNKQWRTWMERLTNYRNFLTVQGLNHLTPSDPHLIWGDAQEIAGVRIGIAGLNSAWSCCDDHDKGKIWCGGDWQIAQIKHRMGPVHFAFALVHHPGNWFTEREDPSITRRLRQEFPIVLHGHEHQDWVEIDATGQLMLSAGSCYDSSWMPNGYSLGQIDLDRLRGEVRLRQWDRSGRGWVARNIAEKTTDGVWPFNNLTWLNQSRERNDEHTTKEPPQISSSQSNESPEEHYARRFCQHVIDQHDILELFGCDIPRELQRHQLSVAYVSLNLSPETEEEPSDSRPDSKTKQPTSDDDDDLELSDPSAGLEAVLDDLSPGIGHFAVQRGEHEGKPAFFAHRTEGDGRLIIRGPAGAGKSTLLRWCAIHAAREVMKERTILTKDEWKAFIAANAIGSPGFWRWKIPVLIRLRDCPDGRLPPASSFPIFLAKHLPTPPAGWMTNLLDMGRVLVLLDGVDEVHGQHRLQLTEEIAELIGTFPDCTYVITTRPGAIQRGWLDRLHFKEARVEPMSRVDRDEFIEKWFRSAALELRHRPRSGENLTQTATRLKIELLEQPELGALASNPLLCAMICALYRERQERLPETPAELCEALVQMLLHRRERETPGLQDSHFATSWRALLYPQKKGMLAELAFKMVTAGESSMDIKTAKQVIVDVLSSTPGRSPDEAPEMLQALVERTGLLRQATDERIDFLHNTLKEYLAAGRIIQAGNWDTIVDRADDPAWQPVILFTVALGPEHFSSGLVRHLLNALPSSQRKFGNVSKKELDALAEANRRRFFLVRCRGAATRLASDLSSEIEKLITYLFPPRYMHEVESLAELGPRILVHTPKITDPSWWVRQDCRMAARCIRLLRLVGGQRAAAVFVSIRKLPSLSSQLTGEWILACSELCEAAPPWPFDVNNRVWASNTRVNDLRPLVQLSSLEILDVDWTRVTDLAPISSLKSLKRIFVAGTGVTDLKPVSEMHALETIHLHRTPVRDLTPLIGLEHLKAVTVDEVRMPKEQLAKFRGERPDVTVHVY